MVTATDSGRRRRSPATRLVRRSGRVVVRTAAMATSPLRAMPSFLVIGTKRGGTTSLFRSIEHHPGFVPLVPSPGLLPLADSMKGVHYFDAHAHLPTAWYRSHFATRLTYERRRRREGAAFTGEASPYSLFHPLAPERAHRVLPDVQLVVMLRDPVERAASHWSEQTRNGVEALSLRDALAAEADRLGDDHERLARGEIRRSHAHEQQSYAAQSEYAPSLRRWLSRYRRDQLLVLFSEDFYAEPQPCLDQVFAAVGVPRHVAAHRTVRNAAPRPPIEPDVRAALEARFAADVAAVAELVGRVPPWPWCR